MSAELKDKVKRIVQPSESRIDKVDVISDVDEMLKTGFEIVSHELTRYRTRVGNSKSLDPKEARIVQGYLESLVKLKREMEKEVNPEEMSLEQLIAYATKELQKKNEKK